IGKIGLFGQGATEAPQSVFKVWRFPTREMGFAETLIDTPSNAKEKKSPRAVRNSYLCSKIGNSPVKRMSTTSPITNGLYDVVIQDSTASKKKQLSIMR
ncbi:unnamed protein product, partial [Ixodes persulcatus]